jgi:Asp-tRNA(Asn)/Glu-tRNA(Gln) amidotransferase C subunit
VLREDAARPSLARDEVLAGAPDAREGCFAVPLILEAS